LDGSYQWNTGASDTLICRGDPLLLHIPMPGIFEWSTGETGNSIAISEAGFYSGLVQNIRWDGTFNGKPLETGVYLWTFEYEYDRHGKTRKEILSGTITLVK
jgi:hypothetical protein